LGIFKRPIEGHASFRKTTDRRPIVCPYHGWAFEWTLEIPNATAYPKEDIEGARFNFFKTDWCGDFLFVSVTPELALGSQLSGLEHDLASISRSIGYRTTSIARPGRAIGVSPWENALEPDHVISFTLVHLAHCP